jgi:anti-sigma factor RsiW
MSCETVRSLLPALAGGELGGRSDDATSCAEHLAGCPDCTDRLESLRRTILLARRVGKREPLPAGFAAALHLRLAHEPPPRQPLRAQLWRMLESLGLYSRLRLGALAAAAGLLLLLAVGPTRRSAPSGGQSSHGSASEEVAAAFQVPQQRVAVVRFDFVADVDVPDVEFEVTLPSELHFIDDGQPLAAQKLVWRGSLLSGSNPVPLAVRGSKPGRYRVTAQARGAGVAVRHDILLEVTRS